MSRSGEVVAICIAPPSETRGTRQPMRRVDSVVAIAGHGLEGDRYCTGEGSYSKDVGHRQVTFINAAPFAGTPFEYVDSRRNIVVSDRVDLMWLIGRFFHVGEALFYGEKYCDPCRIPSQQAMERLGAPQMERKAFPHFEEVFCDRGGLVAMVIEGGTINVGDTVTRPKRGDGPDALAWWWNLDRDGQPLDVSTLPTHPDDAPPLKAGSPYTSTFLVEGELPEVHLHHKEGRITGIHGEGEVGWLRLQLRMCLSIEERIFRELGPTMHHFDIPLTDVLALLRR